MKIFNKKDRLDGLLEFKPILYSSQEELYYFLQYILQDFYEEENIFYGIEGEEDYIVCKGSPIALVAHLDTVHNYQPSDENLFFDSEKEILWSPVGVGGDDRNGVFAILKIIEYCSNNNIELPTLIFCKDEEIGCIGATSLLINFDHSKIDINCMIELDRRGTKDSVYYDCGNTNFKNYINSFGFKEAQGSYSDVSFLSEAFPVPYVNLSIGYFNEHTKAEFISLPALYETIEKIILMLKDNFLSFEKEVLIIEKKTNASIDLKSLVYAYGKQSEFKF